MGERLMALGRQESGTQSATTTHALGSGASGKGAYVCRWNLTAMPASGLVRCHVTTKVLTGDTAEEGWSAWFALIDGGGDPIISSDPVLVDASITVQCHVEEVGSNTISIPWELEKIAEYP